MPETENLRVALVGGKTLTGCKISFVLRRKYKIHELDLFQVVTQEPDFDIVILNSEIFIDYYLKVTDKNDAGEYIDQFISRCRYKKIKIIFLEFEYVFKNGRIYSVHFDQYYNQAVKQINDRLNNHSNLIIKCSISYGQANATEKDITDYLQNNSWIEQQRAINNLYPKLNDEIALKIDHHLSETGVLSLYTGEPIDLRTWAELLNKIQEQDEGSEDFSPFLYEKYKALFNDYMIKKKQSNCSFQLVYQLKPKQLVEGRSIAQFRYRLGKMLAYSVPDSIRDDIDFVCPVPNTGLYYAMGLAAGLEKPYLQALEKSNSEIRSFNLADTDTRKKICWNKIEPIKELFEGRSVAIVDEAIFTGTTLKVVCAMLKECSVKSIHLCIPTPICRYHCDNYVHPERVMLLEYLNADMLLDYFQADSICFQDEKVFLEELEPYKMNCTECFLGKDGQRYE